MVADNIAYGIIAGLCVFIVMHNVPVLLSMISPRLLPPGWDTLKEPYNIAAMIRASSDGGHVSLKTVLPPWMRKVVSGNRRFWEYTPEEIESHLEGKRISKHKSDAAKTYRQAERDEMRRMMKETVVTTREVSDLESADAKGANRPSDEEVKDLPNLFAPEGLRR
jgi:AGZA family xanthine/uracil permease-like MFS transporter